MTNRFASHLDFPLPSFIGFFDLSLFSLQTRWSCYILNLMCIIILLKSPSGSLRNSLNSLLFHGKLFNTWLLPTPPAWPLPFPVRLCIQANNTSFICSLYNTLFRSGWSHFPPNTNLTNFYLFFRDHLTNLPQAWESRLGTCFPLSEDTPF